MSGFEVPFAIVGFLVGLLLRRGREEEAKLLGLAIGRRQGRAARLQIEFGLPLPPRPGPPGPRTPPRPPRHRPVR